MKDVSDCSHCCSRELGIVNIQHLSGHSEEYSWYDLEPDLGYLLEWVLSVPFLGYLLEIEESFMGAQARESHFLLQKPMRRPCRHSDSVLVLEQLWRRSRANGADHKEESLSL
jgi:hypothetical protein